MHGDYKPPVLYRGKDVIFKFMEMLRMEANEISKIYADKKKIKMTKEDWEHFNNTNICHICKKEIIGEEKVKDHDLKI